MKQVAFLLLCSLTRPSAAGEVVEIRRVPDGGIQPQLAAGRDRVLHLVYFRGEAGAGDLFYVRSRDGGKTFSKRIRVNSEPGSAVATGTIRGAQIALGNAGRVHVAWNGSSHGKTPHGAPMLYARLSDDGTAFEPQRNLMTKTASLDGGGSVAADREGNVYVVWHASQSKGPREEGHRAVWVVKSTDEGETFAPELRANQEDTGACGCCGLRAFVDNKAHVYVLYRTATRVLTRDMHLLVSTDKGSSFQSSRIDSWNVPKCVMSQSSFAQAQQGVLGAWETKEEVYFGLLKPPSPVARRVKASGSGKKRKHPALASNSRGETLFAWTEGTGWKRGGALAWQLYDKEGSPVPGKSGRRDGVPVWSFPAVGSTSGDAFVIFY